MPVPATGVYEIVAQNETSTTVGFTLAPIKIAPKQNIRAHVMLVRVESNGKFDEFDMEVYISKYVQGGTTHNGPVHYLAGYDITEIYLSADVSDGLVRGLLLVEYF